MNIAAIFKAPCLLHYHPQSIYLADYQWDKLAQWSSCALDTQCIENEMFIWSISSYLNINPWFVYLQVNRADHITHQWKTAMGIISWDGAEHVHFSQYLVCSARIFLRLKCEHYAWFRCHSYEIWPHRWCYLNSYWNFTYLSTQTYLRFCFSSVRKAWACCNM